MKRCGWAQSSAAEENYHDKEWGVPVHDDQLLFEFLILEGAQAGLSWSTILNKRQGYRKAFDQFDANLIARYDEDKIKKLLRNPEIVRNKLKVNAAVTNAKAFLNIQQKYGSFDQYIWQFVAGKSLQNQWQQFADIPTSTDHSQQMSKSLKKNGFKFVGETICYAYMQAVGMVNDHTIDCFRHKQIEEMMNE